MECTVFFWLDKLRSVYFCDFFYTSFLISKKCVLFHSCMLSSLAPDPIRVQSCVCCLFWINRKSMYIYLIIQSELWILTLALSVNGNINFFWNYSETLNYEYIGRIYQMSSWQFFDEFYTILRKFQYLQK